MLLPAVQKVREAAAKLDNRAGAEIIAVLDRLREGLGSIEAVFSDADSKGELVDPEFVQAMLPEVQAGVEDLMTAHEMLTPGHGEGVDGRTARLELGSWILDLTKVMRFLELYPHLHASSSCAGPGCETR